MTQTFIFLAYYLAVGLFTAGEAFVVLVIENDNVKWYDWLGVASMLILWPLPLLCNLLYDKYYR